MPRFLTTAVLVAFSLSLVLSVWLLSSCSAHTLASLQPFAPYVNACSLSVGTEHVQLWKTLLLTFVLTATMLGTIALVVTYLLRMSDFARRLLLGPRPVVVSIEDRSPPMKRWDELREALSSGTLQLGSRAR
ncbi:MAG: hypothetical protein HY421_02840 [Candidatus Kerfeldbacteria bacterium]|nr:hypothetical protein [Candidatus Kerfeldbacteria bacterium]